MYVYECVQCVIGEGVCMCVLGVCMCVLGVCMCVYVCKVCVYMCALTQEIKETRNTARSTPTNVPRAHSVDEQGPQGLRVTRNPLALQVMKANHE